jgi:hypothetical protein
MKKLLTGFVIGLSVLFFPSMAQSYPKELIVDLDDFKIYLVTNSVEIYNKRLSIIKYMVFTEVNPAKKSSVSFIEDTYQANCKTGIVTFVKSEGFDSKFNFLVALDSYVGKDATSSDSSILGELRDRLCKKAGF